MLAYDLRRNIMLGAAQLSKWSKQVAPGGGLSPACKQKAFAFWHGDTLPLAYVVGLRSAVDVAGLEVFLLTYNTGVQIPGLPLGVCTTPCVDMLPRKVFDEALEKGVSVWFLSELILAKACAAESGWIIDCDCIWLKQPPGMIRWLIRKRRLVPRRLIFPREMRWQKARWWALNYLKKKPRRAFLGEALQVTEGQPLARGVHRMGHEGRGGTRAHTRKSACVAAISDQDDTPVGIGRCVCFPINMQRTCRMYSHVEKSLSVSLSFFGGPRGSQHNALVYALAPCPCPLFSPIPVLCMTLSLVPVPCPRP